MKNVLVTGATGFVGNEVIRSLTENGHSPVALIRKGSESKLKYPCEKAYGDVLNTDSLNAAMANVDAVINLVGIIREMPAKGVTFDAMHRQATINVTTAAAANGVRRYIHMSANGTRENAVSEYHITKFKAEQVVMASGLDWTIFRPSLIFGRQDTFINMLAGYIRKAPAFTYFGNGSYLMQPIYVGDVADCFAKSVDSAETYGRTFSLCGDDVVTYKELLKMICRILGKNIPLIPVPEMFVNAGILLFGGFSWFPITGDQFTMLKEGNTCDCSDAFGILDIKRHPLEKTVASYLK